MIRTFALGAAALLGLAAVSAPIAAQTAVPTITAVPGKPNLLIANYDLSEVGYRASEAFVAGTATSYKLPGPATADGVWNAVPAATAPFRTRVVVIRPINPAKFNGTVLVEWLNVTAGQDAGADWMVAHREMIRSGYAWVGVTAQKVGIDGGGIMGQGTALRKADPARYGSLSHPGDAYSFDIFSQVGRAIKSRGSAGLLGGLVPQRVIGLGESQSAAFLTTYVNAVDRLARVYDGFFVHSRFGSSAALSGERMNATDGSVPTHVRFRSDLRVPVLTLITETDLIGARLSGYAGARRPDGRNLRVWELAGAAHADNYMFGGAFIDSGKTGAAVLAKVFQPSKQGPTGPEATPLNPGMPHHYVAEAAIAAINNWVRTGQPPASTLPMVLAPGGEAAIARDANGIARGGIRTPWTEVPTVRLSGQGDPKSFIGMLAGSGEPMTKAELAKLYPGGKADYLRRFTAALDRAIAARHVLVADRQEILEIAAINFDAAP
jgi:hypothetical protein